MLPTKFRVNWPFGSEEEARNRFSRWLHGDHHGYPIGMNLAIFHLQVIPMSPNKLAVNWPFSAEEAKYRFSRSQPWWPSGISDQNDLSYF